MKNQVRGSWRWDLLISAVIVGGVATSGNCALGQVVGDTTLGAENSRVTSPIPEGFLINGGATRGTNLFHSFQEFSVPTNGTAYFNNAFNIENIISRVTGASVSNIDGVIAANGTANLFLINPNGIVFGSNTSLDIGGSFLASTARSVVFDNGFEFSATNPQAPPLLTINVPLGLQYGANPGRIVNQSIANGDGLEVQPGRTLALVGGDIAIEGGALFAPDGRIELGSVAGNSRVSLTPTNTGYAVVYGGVENFQDIRLTQEAFVSTDGDGGGSIHVQGRNVTLTEGSEITASLLGAGKGRGLSVNASDSVQVIGRSADGKSGSNLSAQANSDATGDAGNLTITTARLLISNGAQVSTSTFGTGKGGNLTVNASDSVQVIGESTDGKFGSNLSAQAEGTGEAGDLTITTARLLISNGAFVSATTFGSGKRGTLTVNASDSLQVIGHSADARFSSFLGAQAEGTGEAGDLTITTARLLISDGAQVSASTLDAGRGGHLIVNASDSVQVIGTSSDGEVASNLAVQADRNSTGEAGDLTITTPRLLISNGAQVSASTFGPGKGGNLTVNASESVQLIGESADGRFGSNLSVQANGNVTGNAGNLTITTPRLLISDGALVSASTFGAGKGGNLIVRASEEVQVIGTSADGQFPSRLSVRAIAGSTAGNLTVETRQMSVRDGAEVTVSSPSGQAGNLTITADSLRLNQGKLTAVTGTSGAEGGANITLQGLDLLRMDNESLISASALEDANGGNVTIDSTFIVATPPKGPEGSDITANAIRGNGGRVNITTQGLFGIEFRPQRTPKNDITVSSTYGVAGEVAINSPDVDPSRGLAELPTDVVDASEQIDRRCTPAGRTAQGNSFTITGRGGLPPSPNDVLQGESVIVNWVTLDPQTDNRSSNDTPAATTAPQTPTLTEAQGWMYGSNGEVILTAEAPNVTPQSPIVMPTTCPALD